MEHQKTDRPFLARNSGKRCWVVQFAVSQTVGLMLFGIWVTLCCENDTKYRNTLRRRCEIFLSMFAELRIATFSFVMFLRPPARMEHLGSHWNDFREIWYMSIYRKSVEKIQISLNLTRITGTLLEDVRTFMIVRPFLLTIAKCFGPKFQRKSKHAFYDSDICLTVHRCYNDIDNRLNATITVY